MPRKAAARKEKLLTADDIYPVRTENAGNAKGIVSRIRDIMFFPYDFFERLGKTKGLDGAIGFLTFAAAVPAIYGSLTYVLGGGNAMKATTFGVAQYLFAMFLTIIGAVLTHLLLKLFGAKGPVATTFKTAVYAGAPWFLFSSIPIVSFFGLFWSVYLEVVGLRKTQGVGTLGAIVSAVLPILVGLGILVAYVMANPQIIAQAAAL